MRWEDERYVRVYTRDTADWLALSWDAQALMMQILRKCDRAGLIDLGRRGRKALAFVVGHPINADVIDNALDELVADGSVRIEGEHLIVPNFVAAQEAQASDAARKRTQRERDRDKALASGFKGSAAGADIVAKIDRTDVTPSVTGGHAVTEPVTQESRGHEIGHTVTKNVTPSCAVPSVPPVPCLEKLAGADAPPLELAPLFDPQPQTQDNPSAKSKAKRVTTDRPSSRHASLVDRLCDAFAEELGSKYGFNGGKDGDAVSWLLSQGDDATILARWRAGLRSKDKWLRIASLAQLRAKWNDLAAVAPAPEPAGPPCAAPGCANEGRSEVPGAGAVCGAHMAAWMDSPECGDAPARGFSVMGAAWLERLSAGVAA